MPAVQQHGHGDQHDWSDQFHDAFDAHKQHDRSQYSTTSQDPSEVIGCCAKHRVERREIPDRRDVQWCDQWIGWDEVVVFKEITTHLWREENNRHKDD